MTTVRLGLVIVAVVLAGCGSESPAGTGSTDSGLASDMDGGSTSLDGGLCPGKIQDQTTCIDGTHAGCVTSDGASVTNCTGSTVSLGSSSPSMSISCGPTKCPEQGLPTCSSYVESYRECPGMPTTTKTSAYVTKCVGMDGSALTGCKYDIMPAGNPHFVRVFCFDACP